MLAQKQLLGAGQGLGPNQGPGQSSPDLSQRHRGNPVVVGAGCGSPEAKQALLGTPEHLRKGRVIVGSPEVLRHQNLHHSPSSEHGKGRYSSSPPAGREGVQRRTTGDELSPHHRSIYNGMNGAFFVQNSHNVLFDYLSGEILCVAEVVQGTISVG